MKKIQESIGQKIRELRVKKGFSQEKFAELVGVHRTYIGMIERGEKTITIVTAKKVSNALEISLSELFKDI